MFFQRKKQSDRQKTLLKISGMHCTSCSMTIDDSIEDLPGVDSSKTNYAKARTEVTHGDEVKADQLIQAVREAGYQAEIDIS